VRPVGSSVGCQAKPAGVEQCDDGDTLDGDGSDHTCNLESSTASQTVAPRGTVTTDTGMGLTSQPVQVAVTTPTGGTVTISRTPAVPVPPPGFSLLTGVVQITAPAATPSNPLVLVFQLDASIIPWGQDQNTIELQKDGVTVPTCTGDPGVAAPDPCIVDRTVFGSGGIQITVLTSTASTWSLLADACGNMPQTGCAAPGPQKASLALPGSATSTKCTSRPWYSGRTGKSLGHTTGPAPPMRPAATAARRTRYPPPDVVHMIALSFLSARSSTATAK
jgi:cysteine-rich repeat protein